MTCPRLCLNHVSERDWLIALEFGRVDDAQPPDNWRGVGQSVSFLHDGRSGPAVGFKVLEPSEFDAEAAEVAEIWDAPNFGAPVLGLQAATAGEIVLAARSLFGEQSSINREFFLAAVDSEGEDALDSWLACLQAGDAMAHFGLGYTLYELGRVPEAYRHLRHYTEIAPCGSWNWCWLGKAAEAVGETVEARRVSHLRRLQARFTRFTRRASTMPTKAREEIDNPWRRVFCLEGAWNEDDLRDRSSVLPVLDVLERLEHIEYIHRDVGTRAELEHYVLRWWDEGLDYRVLYFAFHGTTEDSGSRALLLSHETDGTVTIDHLTGLFVNKLQDCVVHFGSCSIFGPDDRAIDTFRERTGARAVTGYARDVGWIDSAAWELALLAVLADYKQLGTALNRLQDDKYRTLRDSLGFKVVRG